MPFSCSLVGLTIPVVRLRDDLSRCQSITRAPVISETLSDRLQRAAATSPVCISSSASSVDLVWIASGTVNEPSQVWMLSMLWKVHSG